MAARDRLGGLAELTLGAMVIMRSLFDVVLIETVGVGQSETDVAGVADTVVFCVQPGSGDSLQFMKAGIVEIPHLVAVTKADLGAMLAELDGWQPRTLLVSSRDRTGVPELMAAIDAHAAYLAEDNRRALARHAQAELWLVEAIRERFGRQGLARAGDLLLRPGASPFARIAEISRRLS
jgi:LAO/AO transport system kinase